ncbi:MAG: glycerol-3-phosphate 1-O-acyltransferase PlsY [Bacilli bacterium]|nr:glycerol-3-phosphate 1-O-acyltransferase PlsY [Bacilli bacterium]MDY6430669.1 glycerol-3-phosphate 1-O-acyltransferase PlsY [Bacilli bacterium]
MVIWVNVAVGALAIILGYLFGAIPTGVVIGKVFFGKDPRDFYSHNSGGTNTGRVLGKKIGVLVIFLDMLKTCLTIYVTWAIVTYIPAIRDNLIWENGYNPAPLWYWLAGLAGAIGHCWPIYLKFKGGKAVACFMGVNAFTSWIEFVCAGFGYLIILKKTKYVSLSSLSAAVIGCVVAWTIAIVQICAKTDLYWMMWTMNFPNGLKFGFEYAAINTIIAVLVFLRHKENIIRLRNGTERKTTDKLENK